jgi:Mg/Co/Ni transporter MgtE
MRRLDLWAERAGWVFVLLAAAYIAGSVALR